MGHKNSQLITLFVWLWLVLIYYKRKILLIGWWLVLIWCKRKILLVDWLTSQATISIRSE
jgi:hypothetical protein